MRQRFLAWYLFVLSSTAVIPAFAEQVLVAVAANFVPPFHEVAMEFEKSTGHHVEVAAGSSGNLYSQIKNGASFDVFFSADHHRPKRLEEGGFGVKDSRFTYALGRIALWSPNADLVKGEETLSSKHFTRLAIANPKTAPYGLAAMQAMQALRIWEKLQPGNVIIVGENLGQTLRFIESGNAELGFVALSQIMDPKFKGKGSRWDVPSNLHEPIKQDAILLTKGKDNPAAKALMEFMSGPQAKTIIERYGYELK